MDYKKILKGVVNIINTTEKSDIGFVNICTYVGENCPELKESDGERIRKGIIRNLEYLVNKSEGFVKDELKERIAWLEKQGEHNSTWSEEDDNNMIMVEDRLSDYLDYIRGDNSLTKHRKNSLKEEVIGYVNWLKSLKDRYTWKPSEEQMEQFEDFIDHVPDTNPSKTTLISIYNDLKKLNY